MAEDKDINQWEVKITYTPMTMQVLECYSPIKDLFMESQEILEQIKGRFCNIGLKNIST